MLFYFTSVYVLAKCSSTKQKVCEERRVCYLLQDLVQNYCFLAIQYDVKFVVWVHELIVILEVLCS